MAEVKWIKLRTDMFDDEKIQLIDALPERDTILYIWVRLLTMAGKVNDDGNVYLSETIPYTDEMLSTIFKRPLNTVRMAMNTLSGMKMITISDDQVIRITNWDKHQNVSELDKIKEQNRIRQKRYYERKKEIEEPNVILTLPNGTDKNRLDKNKESKPPRHKHGEYGHILLTDDQYEKLKKEYPAIDETIKAMDEWIQLKGKPYKDYNLALRKWLKSEPRTQPTTFLNFQED